jgi:hypothetical protein
MRSYINTTRCSWLGTATSLKSGDINIVLRDQHKLCERIIYHIKPDMYLCARGIDFDSFCDFSIGMWNYYESVVYFVVHFVTVIYRRYTMRYVS